MVVQSPDITIQRRVYTNTAATVILIDHDECHISVHIIPKRGSKETF